MFKYGIHTFHFMHAAVLLTLVPQSQSL